MKNLLLILTLVFFWGCKQEFVEGKHFAGGVYADAETLNLGKQVYQEYCMACHGVKGDGKGVAARGLLPPPRNLTQGLYKFGHAVDGGLPTDEDLAQIIRHGLKGSAMLPWDIGDGQLHAVIQYIKTFAQDTFFFSETKTFRYRL